MKMEYVYDFGVIHAVDAELEEIENCTSEPVLKEVYTRKAGELNSGDIEIDKQYVGSYEYDDNLKEIIATYRAVFRTTVEGETEEECDKAAEKAFHECSFGDYEFDDLCDCERDSYDFWCENFGEQKKNNIERD